MIYELQCQQCLVIGEMDDYIEEFECPQCGGRMLPLSVSDDSAEDDDCKTIAISRDEIDEYRKSLKVAKTVDVGIGGMFTSSKAPTVSSKAVGASQSVAKSSKSVADDLSRTIVRQTHNDIEEALASSDATQKIGLAEALSSTATSPISLDDTQIEQPMHVAHLEQQIVAKPFDAKLEIDNVKREISVYKDEILAEIRRERDELEQRWREISYLEEISAKNRTIVMLLGVVVLIIILAAAIYMLFQKDII